MFLKRQSKNPSRNQFKIITKWNNLNLSMNLFIRNNNTGFQGLVKEGSVLLTVMNLTNHSPIPKSRRSKNKSSRITQSQIH